MSYFLPVIYPNDKQVEARREPDQLRITWRANPKQYSIFPSVAVMFLVSGIAGIILSPVLINGLGEPGSSLPFFTFIILVSLPFWYLAVVFRLNQYSLTADAESIVCSFAPVPYIRNRTVSAKGIQQFFVPRSFRVRDQGGICCIDQGGEIHTLALIMPSYDGAHQIVHELMDFYGLEPREVNGHTNATP